jgi:hypothetical protein
LFASTSTQQKLAEFGFFLIRSSKEPLQIFLAVCRNGFLRVPYPVSFEQRPPQMETVEENCEVVEAIGSGAVLNIRLQVFL